MAGTGSALSPSSPCANGWVFPAPALPPSGGQELSRSGSSKCGGSHACRRIKRAKETPSPALVERAVLHPSGDQATGREHSEHEETNKENDKHRDERKTKAQRQTDETARGRELKNREEKRVDKKDLSAERSEASKYRHTWPTQPRQQLLATDTRPALPEQTARRLACRPTSNQWWVDRSDRLPEPSGRSPSASSGVDVIPRGSRSRREPSRPRGTAGRRTDAGPAGGRGR